MEFQFIFLYSIFLTLPLQLAATNDLDCGINGPPVKFPFRVNNSTQSTRYGNPSFDLSCTQNKTNNQTQLTINLPIAGEFTVDEIDYGSQTIWISDPNNCLPKRILDTGIDLTGSPFQPDFSQTLLLFKCPPVVSGSSVVSCVSDDNFTDTFLMIPLGSRPFVPLFCSFINRVTVPGWSQNKSGIQLTWRKPDCTSCEDGGESCGCSVSNDPAMPAVMTGGGLSRTAKYGLIIGVGIPGLLCLTCFTCALASKFKARRHSSVLSTELSASIAPQRVITVWGLDAPTIEKYPKTLLGESKRLPNPSDNVCSICLSEYQGKEVIRTISECNHYFHLECIDEWLRLNGTCPLCRNLLGKSNEGGKTSSTV